MPGQHLQTPAARPDDERRGDVLARGRALPGVPRAAQADALSVPASRVEREHAVLDDPARDVRTDGCEERQLEDVGVPEDVALVAVSGETLGADRRPAALGRGGGDQLSRREPHTQLGILVAVDLDVGELPHLRPCRPVGFEEGVEARRLRRSGGPDGRRPRQRDLPLGVDHDEPVDAQLLARRQVALHGPAAHVVADRVLGGDGRAARERTHRERVIDRDPVARRARVQDLDLADASGRDELDMRQRPVALVGAEGGDHLDAGFGPVLERELEPDRADMAVGEARKPLGVEPPRAAVGIDAAQRALEAQRPEVEPAGVLEDVPLPRTQGPAGDRDLAGGPVGDHHQVLLTGRRAVEEARDVRPRSRPWAALVGRSANPHEPVAEREQRLG